MKRLLVFGVMIALILSACSKVSTSTGIVNQANNSGNQQLTIQATGGASQTDTVGKKLLDSIVIQINQPGSTANKFFVQFFQTTLCNGDSITEKSVSNGAKVTFKWQLNSKVGLQTLKVKVLNNARNQVDSLNVTATALPPSKGWHAGSCIIKNNLYVSNFVKLSTGRLITGFSGDFYPYYSDDNGITWHAIKSYYFNYYPWVMKLAVTPTDEVFIASELDGVFYSPDGGTTWQGRSNGLPTLIQFTDMAYTPNGNVVFTSHGGGIYISNNKGASWTAVVADNSNIYTEHRYVGTQSNGDIYLTETNNFGTVYVKVDHATLKVLPVTNLAPVSMAMYIDPSYNIFSEGYNSATNSDEIYKSVNSGTTWSKIFSYPFTAKPSATFGGYLSQQSDGGYIFSAGGNNGVGGSYYKTTDFVTFQTIPQSIALYNTPYIQANNNYLVVNSYPATVAYYVP